MQAHKLHGMRLPDFIQQNVEPILIEWESFARGIWPKDSPATPVDLRDHAAEIIRSIVADMTQDQSHSEQKEKSQGQIIPGADGERLDDASTIHGISRVGSGLTVLEVVAEYRALRASILRQWQATRPMPEKQDLDDITRFNESVDQSLTRAVASFTHRLDESRKTFLAILGHDLRNPLAAITLCTTVAQMSETAEERDGLLNQVLTSANAVSALVTDLIDFTVSTLGVGLPMSIAAMDLGRLGKDVAGESRGANPGRELLLDVKGDLAGRWDAHRMRQVIANLLGNAMQHGTPDKPVTLTLDGTSPERVIVSVHNHGEPIPADVLPTIFDPLVRGRTTVEARNKPGSVGLGLYIAREIVLAHGGSIAITSAATDGMSAVVNLPRK